MQKKIFIGIAVGLALWAIWYFFIRKTKPEKVAVAIADRNCSQLQSLRDEFQLMATRDFWNSWTDKELTDFIYPQYTALHQNGYLTEVELTGNLNREQKIDLAIKWVAYGIGITDECKA